MRQAEQQTWSEQARIQHQGQRFEQLTHHLAGQNAFYRHKWRDIPPARLAYDRLSELPFTTKRELLEDQQAHPPFGSNLTFALDRYNRFHQTSGTSGRPLRVLDTPQSWQWWADCWRLILDAAGVRTEDRAMLAFSFGPFIGFWAAQEGVQQAGTLVLPGGGLSSAQRLALMREVGATVLICTPSYALHLAEVAHSQGLDPARDLQVRTTIHAGEPGAGIPATRERIESLWGAQAFDHPGASEVGAYAFSCSARRGVHVNEAEFVAEVLDPETQQPVPPGQPGELVITNLGRVGFPVVRYRTGDVVRPAARHTCSCGRTLLLLEGGILGRQDDMVCIRGINVFPSAFLSIFNELPSIGEHRVTAYRVSEMDQLHVEYEELGGRERLEEIQGVIRQRLGIRVSVQAHPPESLPRFEAKAKRFLDRRTEDWRPAGHG